MRRMICVLLSLALLWTAASAEGLNDTELGTGAAGAEGLSKTEYSFEEVGAEGIIAESDTAAVVTPSEPEAPEAEQPTEDGQAWIVVAGEKAFGDIEELIALGLSKEIYIREQRAVELEDIDARVLEGIVFLPDPEVFKGAKFVARLTLTSPDEAEDPSALEDVDLTGYAELPEEQRMTLYVWVMEIIEEEPTPVPTAAPEPTAPPEVQEVRILVQAEGVVQGQWSSAKPKFTLSGIPEGAGGLQYAAILYDRQIVYLNGNEYEPDAEGILSVRFAIMDEMGDIVSASDSATLYLDWSAPESVQAAPSMQKSYAMVFSAQDSLSGAAAMSVDGGENWIEIENGVPMGHVFGAHTVLQSGMLQVRDAAGNIWLNEAELVFGAVEKFSGGGYYGPSKTHSENTTGDDGSTGYAEAYLAAGEEPVAKILINDKELKLAVAFEGEEAREAMFAVQFGKMICADEAGEKLGGSESLHTGEMAEGDDMMLLSALLPEDAPEDKAPVWTWSFDGASLRTLYASGVKTLALRAGESIALIPTEGFAAGTRYTEMKIGGVGSRFFLYNATMQALLQERVPDECNRTTDTECMLDVDVKGEAFRLLPAQGEEMYAEGVCVIPLGWMDLLAEEYPALEADAE